MTILNDLHQAWRSLRKTPGAALVIVITLALGIGANVAIFSVLHGVILQPLPYPEPERLVLATSQFPSLGFDRFWVSPPEYFEYREWNRSMTEVGAYRAGQVSVVGADQPMRIQAVFATASLFPVLGIEPERGRVFAISEDLPSSEAVAVLSRELWQGAFGGDEAIVGRKLDINGQPTTVIGVMPEGFDIEESGARIWLPLGLDPADRQNRGSHYLYLVSRLGEGATLQSARAELETLLESWEERVGGETHTPDTEGHRIQLQPLHEEVVGAVRPALLALLGAVAFVLLIACANVANVLLARSESRQKEIAIRNSVGASRWRVFRLLLVESLVLSFAGAALGLVLARYGLRALLAASPDGLPRTGSIRLDATALLFATAVALAVGVLFGIVPSLQLRLDRLGGLLKEGGLRASATGGAALFRRSLVVAEMALAVGLVVGAGLMIRSLDRLLSVDAGFDPRHLTTFQLYLPSSTYADPVDQTAFFDRLQRRLLAVPGVEAAAIVSGLPPVRAVNANDMEFEGIERTEDGPPHNIDYWQFVSDTYLETVGIELLEGRGFGPGDDGAAPPVALVNRRATEVWWPDRSAIGQRLRPGWGDFEWFTIVGVVEDVKQAGLDEPVGTEVYWSYRQVAEKLGRAPRAMQVIVRSELAPAALADSVQRAVWALDPALPVSGLRSMEDVFGASVARSRFLTLLLAVFGGLAMILAAIGIYGVMSYSVARRGQELGIRMAMGADRRGVLRLVMTQGVELAIAGLALGVLAAWALTRLMGTLLFGVGTTDPLTYGGVLALLFATALAACVVPALRATRVDPLAVLRSE